MTTAFWLYTSLTLTFLAACSWAYWVTGQIAHLLNAADVIRAHTEAAAQHATRAGLDARAMLEEVRDESAILRDWWHAHSDPDPETEPMRRVGTDTAQAPKISEFGPTPPRDLRPGEEKFEHDAGIAEVMAHADDDILALRKRWDEIAAAPYEDDRPRARVRKATK